MTDIFEIILLLKSSEVFEQVMTEDLRYVAQAMEIENYVAGEKIFSIGDYGDYMYVLKSGRLGLSRSREKKTAEYFAYLQPGDCFGEMNLLDNYPRSASVHVLEDSTLLALERNRLRSLIALYPEISLGMLKGLSMKIRESHERETQLLNQQ